MGGNNGWAVELRSRQKHFGSSFKKNPLFNARIEDILEINENILVIATRGNGILLWDRKADSVGIISIEEGLSSNTINELLKDPGEDVIWVATNRGVDRLCYDREGIKEIRRTFGAFNGMNSTDVRQLYHYNDKIFLATNQDISYISIEDIKKPVKPLLNIESALVNDSTSTISSLSSLAYDENDIQLNYRGISYNSMGELYYEYFLDGFDNKWHTTRENNIRYPSLPPGNYTLLLRAVSLKGILSELSKIKIGIDIPFWQSWWFRGISGLLLLGLIYLITKTAINRYKRQAQLQKSINDLRSLSLRSRMNPHFIFNSLNSVQNYILKNQGPEANNFLLKFSRLMRLVLQNTDSPEIELVKELEMVRLYVNMERVRVRTQFGYEEKIDQSIDRGRCLIPSLLIQPFIENAIWHGRLHTLPDGKVELSIMREGKDLKIRIIDNGIGRKAAKELSKGRKYKSFATYITEQRLQLFKDDDKGPKLHISDAYPDRPNPGTCVDLELSYKLKS